MMAMTTTRRPGTMVMLCLLALLALLSASPIHAASKNAVVVSGRTTTTTTTTNAAKSSSNTDHRSLQNSDYEPWPATTPVYWEFPQEGWWAGTIQGFDATSGMYEVKWEDGSIEFYDDLNQVDQMVAQAHNDPSVNGSAAAASNAVNEQQYPTGTVVSEKEAGIWYDGSITSFNAATNMYTITWDDDGEKEHVQAGQVLDQMVADALPTDDDSVPAPAGGDTINGDQTTCLWTVGTPVAKLVNDVWYIGSVTECYPATDFRPTKYFIEWPPEASDTNQVVSDELEDPNVLNQLVADAENYLAAQKAESRPAVGDDDDTVGDDDDTVGDDDDSVGDDDGSAAAAPDRHVPIYPKGTDVYYEFEDEGWWYGHIESHYDGMYAIRWSDHSVDLFDVDDPAMAKMVADGQFIPDVDDDAVLLAGPPAGSGNTGSSSTTTSSEESSSDSNASTGMNAVGKLFVSLAVLGVVAVGAFLCLKCRSKKNMEKSIAKQRSLDEPYEDNVSYRDDPDDRFPKII